MDEIIARITSEDPNRSLPQLLSMPLGLDVWESKPERAARAACHGGGARSHRQDGLPRRARRSGERAPHRIRDERGGRGLPFGGEPRAGHAGARREAARACRDQGDRAQPREPADPGTPNRRTGVRKLLFMGCHHAREWLAVKVPFLLARELIERADEAPIAGWLGKGESWIAPMVNPDGHAFCRGHNRLWRKNRRPNPDGSFGVDPNRNYGYMWGVLNTSSHVPSDDTYIGPRAFSEPETRAIRDLVAAEKFAGLITYHSYSQLILYPWGYTVDEIVDPVDRAALSGLAKDMARRDQGRARRRVRPRAVLAAVPDRRRHDGLDLWHLRHPVLHHRAPPELGRGGRLRGAGKPDRADLSGEPRGGVPADRSSAQLRGRQARRPDPVGFQATAARG